MSAPSHLLLHIGMLIDGRGGAPVEDAAMVIRDGVITFVGRRADAPQEEGALVIDATGLTALPGLIDGHNGLDCRLSTVPALRGYLQHGVTTVVAYQGNLGGVNRGVALRDAIDAGQLPGCARLVVGHVVNATHTHNVGYTADGPWEVRRAVREMVAAGADFIKASATGAFWPDGMGIDRLNYTPAELEALVSEAHAWQIPVVLHAHTEPGIRRSIEAGADAVVHASFISRASLETMAERKTCLIPTLRVTSERNIHLPSNAPGMKRAMAAAAPWVRNAVGEANRLGVPLVMGSHGPGSAPAWQRLGETSGFELAEMVACGLTPLEAIGSATLAGARAYRMDHRVGSLEVGKEADLILMDGNPAEKIALFQDPGCIALVFLKGRAAYDPAGRVASAFRICGLDR